MVRRARRASQLARWPLVLALVAGGVLGVERLGVAEISEWVLVLSRMVLAVSVAAVVIAGFMAFVTWWFWSRHPR